MKISTLWTSVPRVMPAKGHSATAPSDKKGLAATVQEGTALNTVTSKCGEPTPIAGNTGDSRKDGISLSVLRNTVGAMKVEISAFEREHGCNLKGDLLDQYNGLLRSESAAKAALRCALAEVAGEWPNPVDWL